jgi:hypothetical protein
MVQASQISAVMKLLDEEVNLFSFFLPLSLLFFRHRHRNAWIYPGGRSAVHNVPGIWAMGDCNGHGLDELAA